MMRFALMLFAICAGAAPAAPVPKELKKEEKLQGTWKVESLVNLGNPNPANEYWTIDADGNLSRHPDLAALANSRPSIVLKQDRATKSLDYVSGQLTYFGLYRLQGDTLEFCLANQGQERPMAIEATPNNYLWTLKRVKTETKK